MPGLACQRERDDLVACLLKSDCVMKSGKTPADCIKHREELPLECQHLITSFTDCKKGMLDMRRRFRGNHLSTQDKSGQGSDASALAADIGADFNQRR